MVRSISIWALVALLLAAVGALSGRAEAQGRRLAPSDTVQIRVLGQPELDGQIRIAPDGTLTVPYGGRIRASGLTEDQLAGRIKGSLERGNVVKNAQVFVNVVGFGTQISVLGAVRSPGAIALDRPTTVLEALSRAGGISQLGGQILVRRRTGKGTLTVTHLDSRQLLNGAGPNPYVSNGDEIVVEEPPVFYLYGFVNRPGVYPLLRAVSIQQALASAGGMSELGSEWRIEVKRKLKDGTIVVEKGELDHMVRPNDTIIVKERWF